MGDRGSSRGEVPLWCWWAVLVAAWLVLGSLTTTALVSAAVLPAPRTPWQWATAALCAGAGAVAAVWTLDWARRVAGWSRSFLVWSAQEGSPNPSRPLVVLLLAGSWTLLWATGLWLGAAAPLELARMCLDAGSDGDRLVASAGIVVWYGLLLLAVRHHAALTAGAQALWQRRLNRMIDDRSAPGPENGDPGRTGVDDKEKA